MRHFNRINTSVILTAMLGFFVSSAHAQAPVYYGPLLFSMPFDTSVPPLYVGQPPGVTTAYLWLDDLMRLTPETSIAKYIKSLSWNDTMKTIASNLYQVQDDNPLSFYFWNGSGMHPNPYKGVPGQAIVAFENRVAQMAGDTGRTGSLLTADIIADVMVGDTFCVYDPPGSYFPMVFVNSTILDEIKGKQVPLCVGSDMRARRNKGATAQSSGTIPWETYPVPAVTGGCLQFEYSPAWFQSSFWGSDDGPKLVDSAGGWWIKPGQEYIVFLTFFGIGADSTQGYFTTAAGPAISSGGMYPVVSGIVQDPYDDYGIGASAGLTVAVWKSRLRARIRKLIGGYIAVDSLGCNKQFIWWNTECFGNSLNVETGDISNTTFDTADISGVKSGFFGKPLLTPISQLTIMPNIRTDNLEY